MGLTIHIKQNIIAPLATPLINDNAYTIGHVWFSGSAIVDTKGISWTTNGSPTFGAIDGRQYVTGCSDSVYFAVPTTASWQPAASGPYTAAAIVRIDERLVSRKIIANFSSSGAVRDGMLVYSTTGSSPANQYGVFNSVSRTPAISGSTGVFQVFMFGTDGSGTFSAQVNQNTIVTSGSSNYRVSTVNPMWLGRSTTAGGAQPNPIMEVYMSTEPASSASFARIYSDVVQKGFILGG